MMQGRRILNNVIFRNESAGEGLFGRLTAPFNVIYYVAVAQSSPYVGSTSQNGE